MAGGDVGYGRAQPLGVEGAGQLDLEPLVLRLGRAVEQEEQLLDAGERDLGHGVHRLDNDSPGSADPAGTQVELLRRAMRCLHPSGDLPKYAELVAELEGVGSALVLAKTEGADRVADPLELRV